MFLWYGHIKLLGLPRFMAEPPVAEAKVSRKMQITIPKAVAKVLGGLRAGEYLLFYRDGDRVYVTAGAVRPRSR